MTLLSKISNNVVPHTTTTQKIVLASLSAGVVLLGVLARYLGRRKTPRPMRRPRLISGRRTRNSMRSPNDITSLAGSKVSARSISPGGSIVALSDRLSLASGSLAGVTQDNPLSPQQLGVMGMEALETVINFWEDALVAYQTPTTPEDSEFCREIQMLVDLALQLQDRSELLFLDQRSVLFRNDNFVRGESELHRSMSDPNFDSAESFASALDQIADIREFEEFADTLSDMEQYPLYQSAIRHREEAEIPFRMLRTELVNCGSDLEYLAKLHCIRLAFQYLFKDESTGRWVADTGRQILSDLLVLGDKDPKDFFVEYEAMLDFLQDQGNWSAIEKELQQREVKAMTFYDVVLDFIILDAFRDLDSPPASVTAVVNNRFLSNGFKETALTTAVWSVLKAKRSMLKYSNGFMAHFYAISEQISPLMAWGYFGPDENLHDVCHYFRDETMGFLVDIFNFQKCRYTTVEELSDDIYREMKNRVVNIGVKFSQ